MPSWNVHLAIAKQVNNKLKLDNNMFYLGNLLPDVDYGMKKRRHETHYYNIKCPNCPSEILPDYKEFIKHNKRKLKNPIVLGELVHIMTDYYYNKIIFQKYWLQDKNNNIIGIRMINGKSLIFDKEDIKYRKEYKHRDLELYGKFLFNNDQVEFPKYDKSMNEFIKDTIYSKEQIKQRCEYLNTTFKNNSKYLLKEKILGLKYKMISKQELDKMYENCIMFILKEIKEFI